MIIGLPNIRVQRLIHRIPSYFDTPDPAYLDMQIYLNEEPQEMKTQDKKLSMIANGSSLRLKSTATCRGSLPYTTCTDLSTIGYDNTLCSMSGRPFTPQQRVHKKHPTISTEDLNVWVDLVKQLILLRLIVLACINALAWIIVKARTMDIIIFRA